MERERYQRMMSVFDAVCDAEDPAGALASMCGDDPSLLVSVGAMLQEDARSSVFLNDLAADVLRVDDLDDRAPDLPGYVLGEPLGHGGMGRVYEARQKQPARSVAIKVMHPWLVDEQMVERFRGEAQALASLCHVGIPAIYEVGMADGRLFLAMEFVEGRSLVDAMADKSLITCVQTMVAVCQAVHHAHIRGLVHRDLKPANILVLPNGQPKVLDFGLATTMNPLVRVSLGDDFAGTVGYMSPEHLTEGVVDLRSDIFALGICLHQLLGGTPLPSPPGPKDDLIEHARAHNVPTLTAQRPDLPPDLAAIVDRATARSVVDRYEGADALAADLSRWLASEPVLAFRGGQAYILRCFVRRNPWPVALSAALMLSLSVGLAWSLAATAQARAAEAVAAREAHQGEVMTSFLQDIFQLANPRDRFGDDVTVRQALIDATHRLNDGVMADDPEAEYSLRESLTVSLWSLGEADLAESHLEALRALVTGPLNDPHRSARVAQGLAEIAYARGRLDDALVRSLEAQRGEEAIHSGDHEDLGDVWHTRGTILRDLGRDEEAIGAFEQTIAIRTRLGDPRRVGSSTLAGSHNALAYVLDKHGDREGALEQHMHALRLDRERLPPGHHDLSVRLHHVAWQLRHNGRQQEALDFLEQAATIRANVLDPEHYRVADQENLRGLLLWELGRTTEACAALRDAARRLANHYPPDDPRTVGGRADAARCDAVNLSDASPGTPGHDASPTPP